MQDSLNITGLACSAIRVLTSDENRAKNGGFELEIARRPVEIRSLELQVVTPLIAAWTAIERLRQT